LKVFESAENYHPFLLFTPFVPRAFLQDTAFEAFETMMGVLMRQVSRLIPEIDANDTCLLKVDGILLLLQELLSSERSSIAAAKSAMLGDFWTKIARKYDGLNIAWGFWLTSKPPEKMPRHVSLLPSGP
jgi:hypothetical protein